MAQRRDEGGSKQERYDPAAVVHLDAAQLEQAANHGLEFRRDVEKRAAPMFVPSQSADARSRMR